MEALSLALAEVPAPPDAMTGRVAALAAELRVTRLARLRDAEERERLALRHATLLDALPGGVVLLDAAGFVRDCNPAALEMLGEPLLDQPWAAVLARATAEASPYGGEIALRSGRRITIAHRRVAAGELLLVSDTTEAHLVRGLRERHDRLAGLGRMAAQLAHQVRTPLAAAMLHTDHLAQELTPGDRTIVLRKLQGRLRHVEDMVAELLAYARGDHAELAPVALEAVLEDAALDLAGRLAAGGRLTIRSRQQGLMVRAHRGALAGAVANLVVNALDLLGRDADVLVEVEAVTTPAGQRALVHVADNGPGVAPEVAERIFEPFFTTRQGGTGLGLAIVQSVARALGGAARLAPLPHSALHDGAHFILELPVLDSSGEAHVR